MSLSIFRLYWHMYCPLQWFMSFVCFINTGLSIKIVGCCCKGDLYVRRSRTLGAINANKWTTIKQIHIFGNP